MKLVSLLIGAALGVAGGMYYQKKKDEKMCPVLPKTNTETGPAKIDINQVKSAGEAAKPV